MSDDCGAMLIVDRVHPRYNDGRRETVYLECLEYDLEHEGHYTLSKDITGRNVQISWHYEEDDEEESEE